MIQFDSNMTLEILLDNVMAEYMQVAMVPSGRIERRPTVDSDGNQLIVLRALCHYEEGCPRNYSEFIASAIENEQTIGRKEAFAWWARSRLRYSCSTVTAAITQFFVPSLNAAGIAHLRSVTLDANIKMENLEIYTIGFIPKTTEVVELTSPRYTKKEPIQPLIWFEGYRPHCSHNFMKCKESGIIVDCTLGQFLGTMKPYIFSDMDKFLTQVPGEVLYYSKTNQSDIDQQVGRDSAGFRSLISPDSTPNRFTKRVLRSCHQKKEYCINCKGISSIGSNLKTCTGCKVAKYCSRDCQELDWRSHKLVCQDLREGP
mmetsp:Transcript_16242/g.23920  ORF Transcript_16242/g.23920 Transcript_16242/m.23920 type:complete len:315 (-) Transcript_16242:91-1035(-)